MSQFETELTPTLKVTSKQRSPQTGPLHDLEITSDQPASQVHALPTTRFAQPPLARRLIPLAGGILALGLAGFGESQVEHGDTSAVGLILYLIAIACFTISA
jgi:hypothetical protein